MGARRRSVRLDPGAKRRHHVRDARAPVVVPRMSRIAYVNGRYLPLRHPAIQVEDRGLQFADSVY